MCIVAFIYQKPILLTLDAHKCGIRKIIITIIATLSLCLFINSLAACLCKQNNQHIATELTLAYSDVE